VNGHSARPLPDAITDAERDFALGRAINGATTIRCVRRRLR